MPPPFVRASARSFAAGNPTPPRACSARTRDLFTPISGCLRRRVGMIARVAASLSQVGATVGAIAQCSRSCPSSGRRNDLGPLRSHVLDLGNEPVGGTVGTISQRGTLSTSAPSRAVGMILGRCVPPSSILETNPWGRPSEPSRNAAPLQLRPISGRRNDLGPLRSHVLDLGNEPVGGAVGAISQRGTPSTSAPSRAVGMILGRCVPTSSILETTPWGGPSEPSRNAAPFNLRPISGCRNDLGPLRSHVLDLGNDPVGATIGAIAQRGTLSTSAPSRAAYVGASE
jgi:hypothetical protein